MGAGASTITLQNLTAEEVGKLVHGLGGKFKDYENILVDNAVSGVLLHEMDEAAMKAFLIEIGISNTAHITVLATHFKKLKGGGKPSNVVVAAGGPDCCQYHPLPADFAVGEVVTKTPRHIMTKLFEIQGIAVDPSDVKTAIDKIEKAVGGGFGDGKTKYDCFINYRVAADADLAEKLYLYLEKRGIYAYLDKQCLKSGEKWKDGFLNGLKNSKCFLALISKKALERVRDKSCDHTGDNVLLEYETALNIKDVTNNPKFICPLHVGECNGGTLSKFQEFSPAIYPDSITAIVEDKAKAAPKPKKQRVVRDDDEQDQEQEEQNDNDGDDEDYYNDGEPLTCNICCENVTRYEGGNAPTDWSCAWPGHEGENSFSSDDPFYACPTVDECNWSVCETCYKNYMADQSNDSGEGEVIRVPQPEGTKSVYSAAYYCEVKSVRFQEYSSDYFIMVVEYNVRGDLSLGELQDPRSSTVRCDGEVYNSESIKVYFKDSYQNRGELTFHIPTEDAPNFESKRVGFVFGVEGYSEARLVMPNSSLEGAAAKLPTCSYGNHIMVMSDYCQGPYAAGYVCDICREGKRGFRWFCGECSSDKCFSCEPIQVLPAAKCSHGHALERCSGTRHGSRQCDVCSRRQLQYDPEFYHCGKDNYDLCLTCASQAQAEVQEE